MAGQATIYKRQEDTIEVWDPYKCRARKYKRPSGEVYLDRLLRLLRKQHVRHRVILKQDRWLVKWV